MALSQPQYLDIINEYSRKRLDNRQKEDARRQEIYAQIPVIQDIDQQISHRSISCAKFLLFHPDEDQKEALHEEIYRLSMEKVNQLVLHGYPPDYLDPIYDCPDCKDTGYIGAEKCHCFEHRILEILCNQSNLQDAIKRENFSTFRIEYYPDTPADPKLPSPRENIRHVLEQSRDFIRQFEVTPGANLMIYGSTGVGKTFLTNCIAGELLRAGKSVIYLTAYQFFQQLADYTFRREEGNQETLPQLLRCDLLIIDDLGTELTNAFSNSELFLCINERILHRKSTIISTNLSLKQISSTYSERISSRIIESYSLIHIYGEDIRIKKAVSSLD